MREHNIFEQKKPENPGNANNTPERLARCRAAFELQCFRNCALSSQRMKNQQFQNVKVARTLSRPFEGSNSRTTWPMLRAIHLLITITFDIPANSFYGSPLGVDIWSGVNRQCRRGHAYVVHDEWRHQAVAERDKIN